MEDTKAEHRGDYETRDFNLRAAARLGLAFIVVMAVLLGVTTALQFTATPSRVDLSPHPPSVATSPNLQLPPAPALQPAAQEDLQSFRAKENEILQSYGWVDQNAGVVRIPIDRAMDLLLQRGLPTRPDADSQNFTDKGDQLPLDSSSGRTMERMTP
jgi:hypothetical protein